LNGFGQFLKAIAVAATLLVPIVGAADAATLRISNGGEIGSLDPSKVDGDWENRVVGDYIEGLMTEDPKAEAVLGQAASYKVSADGLTYTFKIRDDAKWSDGVPVTSADFVEGMMRLLDPAAGNKYAYLQFPIKNSEDYNSKKITDFTQVGIKAIDDKTVEYTLGAPTPYFLQALTHYTAYPVPKHVIDKVGNDWVKLPNIVANGPYKPVEWVPGSYVHSTKNPTYYDAANVKIDDVFYYVLEDQTASLNRYRAGEFDIMTDLPTDQYQFIQDNLPGQAHVKPFLGVYYYVMNQSKPPPDNKNIREALSLAVNREVIGPDVLGTGELPAYGWVPPGTANYPGDAYKASWQDLSYDDKVAKAKKLMEDAGYSDANPLKLQLKYNTNDNHKRIAVAISAMWQPIHVQIELFNSETRVHYDSLQQGDFQVGRAGWLMDYNDPDNMLQLLETGNGNNYGRYSNKDYDALVKQERETLDMTARAGIMHKAEALALDDFAVIPIYYYVSKNVVSPKVTGFVDNAKDIHRTRYLTLAP
jgi:oligopeptide transport system substrate-binding protein